MERHRPTELEQFVQAVCDSLGVPTDIAEHTASSYVGANVKGHGSQGLIRLQWMVQKIERGELDPTARPEILNRHATIVQMDGNSSLGPHVGREVVTTGVETTDELGSAVVSVRNANDFGRVGEWAERAADDDMILIAFVNGKGDRTVAPDGCSERIISTNPIAIGIPTFGALDAPIVLDMATSQVSYGTILQHHHEGEPLHPEWTTSGSGDPITDAGDVVNKSAGAILPLGGRITGYKGFGLGLANELIAGMLSQGTVAGQAESPPSGNDAVFVFLDPLRFSTMGTMREQVATFERRLHEVDEDLRFPGERTHRIAEDRRRTGVPLPPKTIDVLRELAEDLDIVDSLPSSFGP